MSDVLNQHLPATNVTQLPMRTGGSVQPIIPKSVEEVAYVAKRVILAGLAPDSYQDKGGDPEKTRSRIMIGIMKGAEVGLPPMAALATIAIINNRPCIWGDGALALIHGHNAVEYSEERFEGGVEGDDLRFSDDFTAVFTIRRRGMPKPYVGRFSVRDAKRAKLWGSNREPWLRYPKRMLMWRARSYAIRDGFADLLMGLSMAEEISDLPPTPQGVDQSVLDDGLPTQTAANIPAYPQQPLSFELSDVKVEHEPPWEEPNDRPRQPEPEPDPEPVSGARRDEGADAGVSEREPDSVPAPGADQAVGRAADVKPESGVPRQPTRQAESGRSTETSPSTPEGGWERWVERTGKAVDLCKTAQDIIKLRDEVAPLLDKAPPVVVGQLNRRFRDRGKYIAGAK